MRPSKSMNRRFCNLLFALFVVLIGMPLVAQKAKALPFKKETFTNSVGMSFVKIPAGSFIMGSGDTSRSVDERCTACGGRGDVACKSFSGRPHYPDAGVCAKCNGTGRVTCSQCRGAGFNRSRESEELAHERPAHRVKISHLFFLQTTEVTQGQWNALMGTKPWAGKTAVKEGNDYPAMYLSWDDAQAFIQKLNAKGKGNYRLPTEAEWEYACRAGTSTKYSFGDDDTRLGEYAWFKDNSENAGEGYPHRVGSKRPNPWGLYDMHGNVMEWCQDWYREHAYESGTFIDPIGPPSGDYRVQRGGSWNFDSKGSRSAYRSYDLPNHSNNYCGFRLVKVIN